MFFTQYCWYKFINYLLQQYKLQTISKNISERSFQATYKAPHCSSIEYYITVDSAMTKNIIFFPVNGKETFTQNLIVNIIFQVLCSFLKISFNSMIIFKYQFSKRFYFSITIADKLFYKNENCQLVATLILSYREDAYAPNTLIIVFFQLAIAVVVALAYV